MPIVYLFLRFMFNTIS